MEETPKSRYHLQRLPTPRLGSRRKSLFMDLESPSPKSTTSSSKSHIASISEQELDGIGFLDDNDTSVEEVLKNVSALNAVNTPIRWENPPQHERSLATPFRNSSMDKSHSFRSKAGNTPMQCENPPKKRSVATPYHKSSMDQEDLPTLLNSMSLKKSKKERLNDKENMNIVSAKRHMNFSPREEPAIKVSKVKDNKVVSPIETKNFYSNPGWKSTMKINKPTLISPLTPVVQAPRIKKRRKTIHKTHLKPTSIENILNTINSDKLRSKILAHREQRQKLALVHQILMNSQNPIAMAVPLNINRDRDKDITCDFSDLEECIIDEVEVDIIDESEPLEEEIIETNENKDKEIVETEEPKVEVGTKRKFFKSKDRSRKEVKLLGKMTGEITGQGKMTLKTPVVKSARRKSVYKRRKSGKFLIFR